MIGFDPKLFTKKIIKYFFKKICKFKPIKKNLLIRFGKEKS